MNEKWMYACVITAIVAILFAIAYPSFKGVANFQQTEYTFIVIMEDDDTVKITANRAVSKYIPRELLFYTGQHLVAGFDGTEWKRFERKNDEQ